MRHYTPAGWVEQNPSSVTAQVFEDDESAAVIAEVLGRLRLGSEEISESTALAPGREIPETQLVTAVVVSLAWDYQAAITGLFTDQWSAVQAQAGDRSFITWVQCYLIEAGIAMTWKLFADREPNEQ